MVPIGGLSEYAKSGLPTAVKGICKVACTGTRTLAPVWQGLARGISLTPCPRLGTKQAYE